MEICEFFCSPTGAPAQLQASDQLNDSGHSQHYSLPPQIFSAAQSMFSRHAAQNILQSPVRSPHSTSEALPASGRLLPNQPKKTSEGRYRHNSPQRGHSTMMD